MVIQLTIQSLGAQSHISQPPSLLVNSSVPQLIRVRKETYKESIFR